MRITVVAVATALLLGACQGEAGRRAASTPGAAGAGAVQEQRIQVSNTLAAPMSVVAVVAGRAQELGTVAPKQEGSFTVRAAPGTNYQIEAMDSTNQHRVQATLMGASGGVLHFVIR